MFDELGALAQLERQDPARALSALSHSEREAIHNQIVDDRTPGPQTEVTDMPRLRRLRTRRITIGSLTFAPIALVAAFAVTAVATASVVTVSATSLFQADPQGKTFNGDIETVLPATVHQLNTVSIPEFGQVQVWGATTKPGGFCFGLKMPDGSWGGYPLPTSLPAADGWDGGTVPGCFQTQQQQTLNGGGSDGAALESWDNLVTNSAGQTYVIYVGYAEAQGTAAVVRDSATGFTAPVTSDGFYALSEPAPLSPAPAGQPAGSPSEVVCGSCDEADLQVASAAGNILKPDYGPSGIKSGYAAGPTAGTAAESAAGTS